MRKLFFIIAFISTSLFAQTSYSFKISDLDVSGSGVIVNSNISSLKIKIPNGKIIRGYLGNKAAQDFGFKTRIKMLDHIITEFQQRKSLFPQATIQFKVNYDGEIIFSDKTLRLINTGETDTNQNDILNTKIKMLEKQIKELKENLVAKETFNYVENKLKGCYADVLQLQVTLAKFQTNTDNSEVEQLMLDWLKENESETKSVVKN